jgi:hypothetical protein
MTNPRSAGNAWNALKKKLMAPPDPNAPPTPKKGGARKKKGVDGEKGEGNPKKTTRKRTAKEPEEGDASPKKKGRATKATTKAKQEPEEDKCKCLITGKFGRKLLIALQPRSSPSQRLPTPPTSNLRSRKRSSDYIVMRYTSLFSSRCTLTNRTSGTCQCTLYHFSRSDYRKALPCTIFSQHCAVTKGLVIRLDHFSGRFHMVRRYDALLYFQFTGVSGARGVVMFLWWLAHTVA